MAELIISGEATKVGLGKRATRGLLFATGVVLYNGVDKLVGGALPDAERLAEIMSRATLAAIMGLAHIGGGAIRGVGEGLSNQRTSSPGIVSQYNPGTSVNRGCDYRVQPGDTLFKIASSNGTTVQELAVRNGLPNPNTIGVGQCLDLP